MPVTSEVTSDYSGSLTPTTSGEENEEEEEDENARGRRVSESSSLLWTGTGGKRVAFIMFRPESLIARDKRLKGIGEKFHLAYKMVKTESKLVRSVLSTYGFHEVHPNSPDFNLMWTGAHLKPFSLRSLQDFQKVNHFPRSYEITRKDRLFKNIDRMAHTKGAKHFDFMPRSYLMPSEYQDFCAAYVKDKGPWIVKPIASSRGRGIYLINNPNQVPLEDNIMVCKYISNPLLIDGFKFDVRVYIAVTSYDPLMIYLFEEGLTRFATVKYEKTHRHLKNQMMHLTNYSINKKSHDYVRCEDPDVEDYGNKWSMSAMLRYLKQEGIDTTSLMMRIESVIIKAIIAAELPIATACKMFVPNRENCMELYGFDVLVDENLKPWLLEGNLSPSLACDAPLDLKIKSCMVSDFFSLVGFQCVDPLTRRQKKDQIRRPYSASKGLSGVSSMQGTQSKRPVSASAKEASASGLSSEEAKVLRIAKEQYQRRGSFIRIFPTPETWELYGSFLEYKSSLNLMLAQKLFPDRLKSKVVTGAYSSAVARMRSLAAGQMLESRNRVMAERFMQYERKLLSLESLKHKRGQKTRVRKRKATPIGVDNKALAQGQLRDGSGSRAAGGDDSEEDGEDESDADQAYVARKETPKPATKVSVPSSASSKAATKAKKQIGPRVGGGAGDLHPLTKSAYASTRTRDPSSAKSSPQSAGPLSSSSKTSLSAKVGAKSAPKERPTGTATTRQAAPQRVYTYKSSEKKDGAGDVKTAGNNKAVNSNDMHDSSSDDDNSDSSSESDKEKLRTPKQGTHRATNVRQATVTGSSPRTKQQKKTTGVLEALKAGGNLGKVQARQAFSAYLSRVQQRLMMESESQTQENPETVGKQEEQMDLVLRFLRRAAGNLRQSFSVVVPSRRLCLRDRKRILAKQLGDFVHIYNKETDVMEQKQSLGLDKEPPSAWSESVQENVLIRDSDFHFFVLSASETELEEVLTTYTHKNKSASVFLGASKPKSREKKEVLTPAPTVPSTNRLQPSRLTSVDHLPSQPLVQTGHLYQAEEHREGLYELNLHRRSSPGLLRMRSPSPASSIVSLSSRGAGAISHPSGAHPSTFFQPHQSSLQQAAYVYSAKLTPPTSVASAAGQQTPQKRPASARDYNSTSTQGNPSGRPISAAASRAGLQAGSLHYQTAANEEAIADALQKLAERQAARQYSATSQLQALTQHLSSINLANMTAARQHQHGHHQQHALGSQRASSLSDLAGGDPSIQSMIDPAVWEAESNRLAARSNQNAQSQSLAQQSKELFQQSKAKHQAMVAQMLDDWGGQSTVEVSSTNKTCDDPRASEVKTPENRTESFLSSLVSEDEEECAKEEASKEALKCLGHAQDLTQCTITETGLYHYNFTEMYVPIRYTACQETGMKETCQSLAEQDRNPVQNASGPGKEGTQDTKVTSVVKTIGDTTCQARNVAANKKVSKERAARQGVCKKTTRPSVQMSGSKPKSRVESVWNSYHAVSSTASQEQQSSKSGRLSSQENRIKENAFKVIVRNSASEAKSKKADQKGHITKNKDMGATVCPRSGDYQNTAVKNVLARIKGFFDSGDLSCKRWRYQSSGPGYKRPSDKAKQSTECCVVGNDEESAELKEATQAHNAVTSSTTPKLTSVDEAQSPGTPNGPKISISSSPSYASDATSNSRPPQVPRPPERPKPIERPPPIRKTLGNTKVTRMGSHPQLTGLSPNPSSLALSEDGYNLNFYSSLKYDPSTGSTRVVDGAPDSYRANGIAADAGSRPSSAKRPTWKP